jgi:outer membrane protein assembly factor BamB
VYRWEVHCLDLATGKTLWKQLALEAKPRIPTHSTNTYASETPVTDGERLYVYFGMTGLFCYDLAGNPLWKKDLGSYPMLMGWGTGSSPVLDEDRLFLQCDNEEKSFLVAFDKRTGEELWRMPREERSSWATPYVWRNKKRTELVTIGSQKARSYDPATGKLLWELAMAGRNSASPVADDEMLYLGSGGGGGMFGGGGFGGGGAGGGFGRQPDRGQPDRGQSGGAQQERDREPQERSAQEANTQQERAQERGGQQGQQGGAQPGQRGRGGFGGGGFGGGGGSGALVAVKAGASGDISLKSNETSNEYVAWQRMRAGPAMASPLLYRGYLYVLEQRGGIVSCYDAKTGEPAYAQKRLQGARGFTSSPWASDGKIFCLDDNAQTFVLAAGPEFNLLGTNSLDEMCWSSPAIASGRLLLRTAENLYCFKQP